jgi:hypothetical protein
MWDEQDAAELDEIPSDSIATVQKPFGPKTLLDTIHRLMGVRREVALAAKMKASS